MGNIRRNPMENSPYTEWIPMHRGDQGDGQLEERSVRFPDFDTAIETIERDLSEHGYKIREAQPRLSSDFDPDAGPNHQDAA